MTTGNHHRTKYYVSLWAQHGETAFKLVPQSSWVIHAHHAQSAAAIALAFVKRTNPQDLPLAGILLAAVDERGHRDPLNCSDPISARTFAPAFFPRGVSNDDRND